MDRTLAPGEMLVSAPGSVTSGLGSMTLSTPLVWLGVVVSTGKSTPDIEIGSKVVVGVLEEVAVGARVSVTVLVGNSEVAVGVALARLVGVNVGVEVGD